MSATALLRALAIVLTLFAIGHTLGTYSPKGTHDPREAGVFASMQSVRFRMNGFDRSHWDFYRGFALTVGALLFVLAGIAWSTGQIAATHPAAAVATAVWLTVACMALLALSVRFFFAVPIAMSAAAAIIAATAVARLLRAT